MHKVQKFPNGCLIYEHKGLRNPSEPKLTARWENSQGRREDFGFGFFPKASAHSSRWAGSLCQCGQWEENTNCALQCNAAGAHGLHSWNNGCRESLGEKTPLYYFLS